MQQLHKIINPGTILEYTRHGKTPAQVFIKINYEPSDQENKEAQVSRFTHKHDGTGKFSISGVVGPRANGDCYGSCGQISDTIREAIKAGDFSPNEKDGWTVPRVLEFLDLWDRWHLNDMKPECEHQRAAGWPQQAAVKIRSYMWQLNDETSTKKRQLEAEAIDRAASVPAGRSVGFNDLERKILKLEEFITTENEEIGELARFYIPTKNATGGDYFAHVKEKARGWITYEEDQRGLLGKPCETCGYKYGSAWQVMPLSKNVLDTFQALAPTEIKPAWV